VSGYRVHGAVNCIQEVFPNGRKEFRGVETVSFFQALQKKQVDQKEDLLSGTGGMGKKE